MEKYRKSVSLPVTLPYVSRPVFWQKGRSRGHIITPAFPLTWLDLSKSHLSTVYEFLVWTNIIKVFVERITSKVLTHMVSLQYGSRIMAYSLHRMHRVLFPGYQCDNQVAISKDQSTQLNLY